MEIIIIIILIIINIIILIFFTFLNVFSQVFWTTSASVSSKSAFMPLKLKVYIISIFNKKITLLLIFFSHFYYYY